MAKTFQVWMVVEQHDTDTDEYTDLATTQKTLGIFKELDQAVEKIANTF